MEAKRIDNAMIEAMERAGIRPELIYAYRKTGLIVTTDNRHRVSSEDMAAWDAAMKEYFKKNPKK
jgi:hypothetical protein